MPTQVKIQQMKETRVNTFRPTREFLGHVRKMKGEGISKLYTKKTNHSQPQRVRNVPYPDVSLTTQFARPTPYISPLRLAPWWFKS